VTDETNEARVESTRTMYEGRIFRLTVERVTLPSGHRVEMELVHHPGSVVLLPQPAAGQIVLVRQYRHAIKRWIWEVPAGTLKPGEEPAAAAARECEEEIGLVPRSVTYLSTLYPTPGFCDETMAFFRCTDLQAPALDSLVKQDEDENIEPKTFSLDEARAMVERGEIVDMKTVVGLGMLEPRTRTLEPRT
jgi:ADP-ribose pyrophosphatase